MALCERPVEPQRRAGPFRPQRKAALLHAHSNDFSFLLAGDSIRAGGTLIHPGTGVRVSDVTIRHTLSTDTGHALLDVPGLTFGPNLQPSEITPLTEGVIALVNGTISGKGRIDWSGNGKVTSTGDFSTANMDLAAPFRAGHGAKWDDPFQRLARLEDSSRPAAQRPLDQSRHPRRERRDPLPATAQPAGED